MSGVQVRALSLPRQRNCRVQQQVGAKALRVTMHMQPGAAFWPFVPATWDIWDLSPRPSPSSSFAVSPVCVPSPVYLLDP